MISVFLCCGFENTKTIKFNKTNYKLSLISKNLKGGYFNSFVKEGQSINNYDEAIVIHYVPLCAGAKEEAENLHRMIEKMYIKFYSNKNIPAAITFNQYKNTALLDFVIPSIEKNSQKDINKIEYHAFKYQKNKTTSGIIIFQYSKHIKVTNLNDERFLYSFWCKIRKDIIPEILRIEIPTIQEE